MLSVVDCLNIMGVADAAGVVAPGWEESQPSCPAGGLFFLQPDFWREGRQAAGLPESLEPVLGRTAAAVEAAPHLRRYAWHIYWRVYEKTPMAAVDNSWPEPPELGEDRGVLALLIALVLVPRLRAYHASLGLPAWATRDTLLQLRHFCDDNYRRDHAGRPGMFFSQMSWCRAYLNHPYVRLGRLEYCLQASPLRDLIYRQKNGLGRVLLAEAGRRFTPDGMAFADPAEYDGVSGCWTSELSLGLENVVGHPCSPEGHACRQPIRLALREWEPVCPPGADCLRMHIPPGGEMSPERCRDSLLLARSFFSRYFPERQVAAVSCGSWIFNPGLRKILPAGSNLLRFQEELYLYPTPSGPWDGLWFIYLRSGRPDATFPLQTSLQKRVYEAIARGDRWRCGGMFILCEDLERFGTRFYRRQWPPAGYLPA